MIGWHHRLDGHEFEQAGGDGDGQGGLARCSPRGCKESDTTVRNLPAPRVILNSKRNLFDRILSAFVCVLGGREKLFFNNDQT